jgi:hypothetical protein
MTDETFTFNNLGELKEWLAKFHWTELDTVLPDKADHIYLTWVEETLSDGSTVQNVRISTA